MSVDRREDAAAVVDGAVGLVERWLGAADAEGTSAERRTAERLRGVVADPDGVAFTMGFVDRVIRPDDDTRLLLVVGTNPVVSHGQYNGLSDPVSRLAVISGVGLDLLGLAWMRRLVARIQA